jgi:hypothetical protein
MKRDSRRKILWFFGVLALLCPLTLCGGGFLLFQSVFTGRAKALPSEIELSRKAGLPLEADDLRPKPPIPDELNAATVYKPFFAHLDNTFKKDKDLTKACNALFKGTAKPDQVKLVSKVVDDERDALNNIIAASTRPSCDFHLEYEQGAYLKLSELAQAKIAARLLCTRAILEADRKEISKAFDTIAAISRLAHHMGQVPILVGALVQISIETSASECFGILLHHADGDAVMLQKAQKTLDGFGSLPDFKRNLRGEVVSCHLMIQAIHTTDDLRAFSDEKPDGLSFDIPDAIRQASEANDLRTLRVYLAELPSDPAEWKKARDLSKKAYSEIDDDHSLANILARVVFPRLDELPMFVAHLKARRDVSATALKLLQERLRTGRFPDTLPSYGPIAIDIFDGRPLRYSRIGAGFKLYSIGRDLQDNGGVKPNGKQKGDIVLSFP